MNHPGVLIEDWLPAAAIGVEDGAVQVVDNKWKCAEKQGVTWKTGSSSTWLRCWTPTVAG